MRITYDQEPHFYHIKQAIYDGMGVTFNEIVSRNRNQKIFFARMIFSHLCNTVENATIRSIAEEIKRDHSTILYHLKRYEYDIIYTPEFKRYAEAVKQDLNTLINELQ